MKTGWLGTGVAQFESDFIAYKDVKNAIAINSCTAALHLSLLAADIKQGDAAILIVLLLSPKMSHNNRKI